MNSLKYWLLAFVPFVLFQCTSPTPIGGDLVSDDEAVFGYNDSLALEMKTVLDEDSLKAYQYLVFELGRSYCGELADPVFGQNKATIFAQFGPSLTTLDLIDFEDAVVDSVMLTLVIDSAGYYGDRMSMQSLQVFRLDEALPLDSAFYTNESIPASTPISEVIDFTPNFDQRDLAISPAGTVYDSLAYLRLPLDNSLAQEIMEWDTTAYDSPEDFAEMFKGIKIMASGPSDGLMAYNLKSLSTHIGIYYHTSTEDSLYRTLRTYGYYPAYVHYEQDYSGSVVESHIDIPQDSILFLQGNGGLNIEISLPDLSHLGDIIINKAVLELVGYQVMGDDTMTYAMSPQISLTDTTDVLISDVLLALSSFNSYEYFGGNPVTKEINGVDYVVYQMNLAKHLHDMNYGNADSKIILKSNSRVSTTGRTSFYGFGANESLRPKLFLSYTVLD